MKKKRRTGRGLAGNGSSLGLHTMTFSEAYRDASYAIMIKVVEQILCDPKRRKVIEDLTIALVKSLLEGLEERAAANQSPPTNP